MRAWSFGLSFLVAAFGGGYAINNRSGFEVEVHRPLPDVYAEFSGIHTFGSGSRHYGIDTARVIISRPSDRELIFTIPSSKPESSSKISFKFYPSRDGRTTVVRTVLNFATIPVELEGKEGYLSAEKLEPKFEAAVQDFAERIDRRASTASASSELSQLLDVVAIGTNRDKLSSLKTRIAQEKSSVDRIYGPGTYDWAVAERTRELQTGAEQDDQAEMGQNFAEEAGEYGSVGDVAEAASRF